ncbi:MAG: hypothetical protein IMHGJWDQ_001425 [Candidatus Fervidibacter sp.]
MLVEPRLVTLDDVKENEKVRTFIRLADEQMEALGYTEHGFRHVGLVAHNARRILQDLGFNDRQPELAAIAGYLHDVGNMVSRIMHSKTGALIALQVLMEMGMSAEEAGMVAAAIGNHDEQEGGSVISPITAAVVIADKADVHRSRVRNPNMAAFDIHDRINYAAQHAQLFVNPQERTITLDLTIDTSIGSVFEYFEIFMSRMLFSRKAAEFLGCRYRLVINGVPML